MDLSALNIIQAKKNQFIRKKIFTVEDLINFLPKKYYDFRKSKSIKDLQIDEIESITGKVIEIKKNKNYTKIVIEDNIGWKMDIYYFKSPYIDKLIKLNKTYFFYGKVSKTYSRKQFNNPIFSEDLNKYKKIIPVYSNITGMSYDYLEKKINLALNIINKNDYLDLDTINKFDLLKNYESFRIIHQPRNFEEINKAKDRLIFDELFKFSLITNYEYNKIDKQSEFIIKETGIITEFLKTLPFKLTEGDNSQLSTVYEILNKMQDGIKTSSLIQGDVGCGKTITALLIMLEVVSNGYQTVLMAPTTVLAKQHFKEISERVEPFGIKCAYLGGKMKVKEKREQLENIKNGTAQIIIGTHSIISKSVEFNNLALSIIDEEHRFGVVQRKLLEQKSKNPHTITMSATPIPRSLAMTIYGDFIDVYTIKSMPNGRKKIITSLSSNSKESYEFILKEIEKGKQCYVVCPLIDVNEESDKMKDVQSTKEVYDEMDVYFKSKDVKICEINGKMKTDEINEKLNDFAEHKYDILIATTIIEVGVNVPNSTVILIKNAERFGLATLHQLRGRVGRGSDQSYCILETLNKDTERLQYMTQTTDGFKIAEKDLSIRGMGDFIGVKQSGENNVVMLMLAKPDLYMEIKRYTSEIVNNPQEIIKYQEIIDNYNCLMGEDDEL